MKQRTIHSQNMSDNLCYPDGVYQWIFRTTIVLHPTNIFTAFYYRMNICGIMGVALYMTSLNYWRYPLLNSIRRKIDMTVAKISVGYHLYVSWYTTNRYLTFLPISLGTSLYFVSFFLEKKKYIKTAALIHCFFHFLVSVGASLTYRDYFLQNASPPTFL